MSSSDEVIRSWSKLLDALFSKEDREKIEWSMGAALEGRVKKILDIHGPSGSGKSTILNIAEKIYAENGRGPVGLKFVVRHEGFVASPHFTTVKPHAFMFVASDALAKPDNDKILSRMIQARITGTKLPENEYYQLIRSIGSGTDKIARLCLEKYRGLGPKYYG